MVFPSCDRGLLGLHRANRRGWLILAILNALGLCLLDFLEQGWQHGLSLRGRLVLLICSQVAIHTIRLVHFASFILVNRAASHPHEYLRCRLLQLWIDRLIATCFEERS